MIGQEKWGWWWCRVSLSHTPLNISKLAQGCSHEDGIGFPRTASSDKLHAPELVKSLLTSCFLISHQLVQIRGGHSKLHGKKIWWQGGCRRVLELSWGSNHRLGAETADIYFFTVLKSRNLRSKFVQVWFLLMPSPSANRCSPLPVPSHGIPSMSLYPNLFFYTGLIRSKTIHMTSFTLNDLLKGFIF